MTPLLVRAVLATLIGGGALRGDNSAIGGASEAPGFDAGWATRGGDFVTSPEDDRDPDPQPASETATASAPAAVSPRLRTDTPRAAFWFSTARHVERKPRSFTRPAMKAYEINVSPWA
jgi:hypothetical protein